MEPTHDQVETNLAEYLNVLRRRWVLIAFVALAAVAATGALDFTKTPIYQTSAQLLLQPTQSESIFSPAAQVSDPARSVQNELKIINSLKVRTAVTKAFGSPINISAASGGDDDIIILSATNASPTEAARMVNVYAETYQKVRLDAMIEDLTKARLVIQQQINDFQAQIDSVNKPLADIDARLQTLAVDSPEYTQLVNQRQRLDNNLRAQRSEMENQLSDYKQRLQTMQVSERLTTSGGVQILNPAGVPSSPISPNISRDLFQAALIGLFIGIGLAFLLEQLDDSIRTVGDLERAARPLPTLGLLPLDAQWREKAEVRLSTLDAPMSATAEAYRSLRTALQYLGLQQPMRIVQVTGANATEGKSSTIANLAIAFAEAGMHVAVVGCDLRRPRIHTFLEVDGSIGLTSVLLGETTLHGALQQSPIHPNIWVLPSGPRPPNPSELLSLDRTGELMRSLLDNFSIVFVDSPPVLPVTDALVLARSVDATLFIAMSNSTSKRGVRRAIDRLRQVNSPLVGTILNGVSAEGAYSSLYEYYGYTTPSKVNRFRRRRKNPIDVPMIGAQPSPTDGRPEGTDPVEGSGAPRSNGHGTTNGHAVMPTPAAGAPETR